MVHVRNYTGEKAGNMHRNLPDCRMCDDFRRQPGYAVLGHGHKIEDARGKTSLS
jgi:hypothetical protein